MDLGEVFLMTCEAYSPLSVEDQLPGYFCAFALKEAAVTGRAGAVGVKTDGFAEACPVQLASLVVLVHFEGGLWAVHKVTFPAVLPFIGACTFVAGTT